MILADNFALERAKNIRQTIKQLTDLSKHEYLPVRIAVANNRSTPASLLIELSKEFNLEIDRKLCKNNNTPTDVLTIIYNNYSSDQHVRWDLASNPNTSIEILVELSKDENLEYHAKKNRVNRIGLLK